MSLGRRGTLATSITILCVGDSETLGVGGATDYPGYRGPLAALLRAAGLPVTFVGPFVHGPANGTDTTLRTYAPCLPRHAGVSGNTQADIAARIGAQIAALASPPSIIIDLSGANDAGSVAATMLASKTTLLNVYRAAAANARILTLTLPPVAASGSSQANRAGFNTGLPALVSARNDPRMQLVDVAAVLGADSQSVDAGPVMGTHPQTRGYGVIARTIADAILEAYLPGSFVPSRPVPRIFMPRGPQTAITLPDALDGAQVIDATHLAPTNNGAWWVALDFKPTSIGASLKGLASFGSAYYPNGACLFTNATNNALSLYVSGGGGVNTIAAGVLVVDTWLRIMFGGSPDGFAWVFANGCYGGTPTPSSTWVWGGNTLQLGANSGFNTAPGYYARCAFGYGANAPQTIDAAAVAAERDYWDGTSPGGLAAFYRADDGSGNSILDRNFTATAMTLGALSSNTIDATITGGGGTAAWVTPAPLPAWW